VPLYAANSVAHSDNFYSTSIGQITAVVGSQGYTLKCRAGLQHPGSSICIPFYRLYNSAATEYFYTTSASICASMLANSACADEGVVGYVLDANLCA
ncbi:hypothetical protein C8R43DRAFT_904774, partial [Mycena crocata]